MKTIHYLTMSFVFLLVTSSSAEFFQDLGNAIEDVGHAAGDVVRAPGHIVHHMPYYSGVVVGGQWNGQDVEFHGEFAYIGNHLGTQRHTVRVINCMNAGGVRKTEYVEGEKFFTYRPAGSEEKFTCKYEDIGNAAGDVVRTPKHIVHHTPYYSGVVVGGQWDGQDVEFHGKFAYIGNHFGTQRRTVRVINCMHEGGVSTDEYVEGEQFFTYRPAGSQKKFTCKYIELK